MSTETTDEKTLRLAAEVRAWTGANDIAAKRATDANAEARAAEKALSDSYGALTRARKALNDHLKES